MSPVLLERALAALDQQRWHEAADLARRALRSPLDRRQQTQAGLTLARACWHQGALHACCLHALQADAIAVQSGDTAVSISTATLAAFAFAELDLEEHALPLARRALDAAQTPAMYTLLPVALSCAAHVHARLAHLAQAEDLHMRALSHARESGDLRTLQLAYDNLLVSFITLHRASDTRGDLLVARAVDQRTARHASHIRSVIENPELDEWRRIGLMINLGELLSLSGRLDEAQQLLIEGLERARQLASGYATLAAQTALAEMRLRQGRFEEAMGFLQQGLARTVVGEAGYRRQLRSLEVAHACCRALGRLAEAETIGERIDAARQVRDRMRQDALRGVAPRL